MNRFIKLCTWVYGQEKYANNFRVSSVLYGYRNIKQLKKTAILKFLKLDHYREFMVEVYICLGHINERVVTKYTVSAGTKDDTLILYKLERFKGVNFVYPLEMISNLDPQYLYLVP